MRSYLFETPKWLRLIYPQLTWKEATTEKIVYLTFDDGPDPLATRFVLDMLEHYSAKATFFCIGERIEKYPDMFLEIVDNGHAFGNHTFGHLDGWKTADSRYLADIGKFTETINRLNKTTHLFRPPYGRLKRSQLKYLTPHYRVVMWSHLSGDFDKNLHINSAKKSLLNAEPGSIVLFHDSFAAYNNLVKLLPDVLAHFSGAGFTFKTLSDAVN